MAVLNKSQIRTPTLPKQTVEVPELGGDVVVRGLLLKDRLSLFMSKEPGYAHLSKLLAVTVIDDQGEPIFTESEWETFGSRHFNAAINLFDVARKLSGLDAEVSAKK